MKCLFCQSFSAPGLSPGYCSTRIDLPKAYGRFHPLHQLPPDKGAKCPSFAMRVEHQSAAELFGSGQK